MTKIITAVFNNGALIPVTSLTGLLKDGQQVRVVIETEESAGDLMELATSVYDGLDKGQIDAIEEIALDRTKFFDE